MLECSQCHNPIKYECECVTSRPCPKCRGIGWLPVRQSSLGLRTTEFTRLCINCDGLGIVCNLCGKPGCNRFDADNECECGTEMEQVVFTPNVD